MVRDHLPERCLYTGEGTPQNLRGQNETKIHKKNNKTRFYNYGRILKTNRRSGSEKGH